MHRALRYSILGCVALTLSACGGGSSNDNPSIITTTPVTQKPGVLSISALPRLNPYPTTPQQFATLANEAFDLGYSAGARGQFTSATWSALEPTAGNFDATKFGDLNGGISNAQNHSMVELVGIQVINTTVREMPDDIKTLPFDNITVRIRFHALLDQVLTANNRGKIKYLSIGNEVDGYLRAHPAEWSQYKTFYNDAVQYAHSLDPAIKVGVTGTGDGALTLSPVELTDLNAMSDVIILTYYPLQADGSGTITVREPNVIATDMPMMLNFAGNKPLLLQEIGYPAAALNNSSEAKQAQFVSNVFAAWKNSNNKIPFLNYFVLHDFPAQTCTDFGAYYGFPNNASFIAYLCSLGLRKDDGTPRAAWQTFLNEAAQANLP